MSESDQMQALLLAHYQAHEAKAKSVPQASWKQPVLEIGEYIKETRSAVEYGLSIWETGPNGAPPSTSERASFPLKSSTISRKSSTGCTMSTCSKSLRRTPSQTSGQRSRARSSSSKNSTTPSPSCSTTMLKKPPTTPSTQSENRPGPQVNAARQWVRFCGRGGGLRKKNRPASAPPQRL